MTSSPSFVVLKIKATTRHSLRIYPKAAKIAQEGCKGHPHVPSIVGKGCGVEERPLPESLDVPVRAWVRGNLPLHRCSHILASPRRLLPDLVSFLTTLVGASGLNLECADCARLGGPSVVLRAAPLEFGARLGRRGPEPRVG